MLGFVAVLLLTCLARGWCEKCNDLDGFWYNQLGSEIFLRHSSDGKLIGEYRSAVESFEHPDGKKHSIISGAAPYNSPGATFSFAVTWSNGSSTKAWTGQCLVCEDGKEMLLTSWLKRSQAYTCIDKWKSTMIGLDTFTRTEQLPGPRKPDKTIPSFPTGFAPTNTSGKPCDITGTWYNELGSEVILNQYANGIIVGEYRTAVERKKGSAGESHSKVYGISTPGNPNSTFAIMVVWRGGASVTGWVGQCHICGENKTEIIETTWLLRSKLEKCGDNWKSTMYGENSFTREEQKEGPRKHLGTHTPDRDGEDADPRASAKLTNEGLILWILSFWYAMFFF
ncbi:uncharacterized protein LOC116290228 [Actinia tenebrosa]|uniref:Uncharacterized protein LOC116290228 n=1 Tax=Actinia tenebrosa TaxID=6105 RepID=A0A6P8HKG5_ACTTE|nr:uncharacterized protein LOC116290228 [Actinia tenebrosa]